MNKKRILAIAVSLAAVISLAAAIIFDTLEAKKTNEYIQYGEFLTLAENGHVASVTLSDSEKFSFTIADSDTVYETDNPRNPALKETLLLYGANVSEQGSSGSGELLSSLVSIIFFAGMIFMATRVMNRGSGSAAVALDVAGSGDKTTGHVLFDDVAGNDEAKESVWDIVDFIKNPDKYAKYGARMPRGVIFYGPPGTGKTLMAKAVAGEAGVPFYAVSGSDFVQMYVGVGAARIRALFKQARESGRAVIFIDEIDALGKKRGSAQTGGSDERDQTLNALLTEMSGFQASDGIIVFAATNRLDTLDEALLRPGRFDRQVEISLPDLSGRERILRLHGKNKPVSERVNIPDLAKQTVFFSGAMLENLMNEAAICAAKKGAEEISSDDMEEAYYTIVAGKAKKEHGPSRERDKKVTAFHEAGHALASKKCAPDNSVAKITIIPSTRGAGGFCVNIPPDKMYYTKAELEAQVIVSLAGRAAEELIFGEDNVTTGAANDLEKAAAMIKDLVSKYGMSETAGLAPFDDPSVREEYRTQITRLYGRTKEILSKNMDSLKRIANALLLKETINEAELDKLISEEYA